MSEHLRARKSAAFVAPDIGTTSETRLHGRLLMAARALWALLLIVILASFAQGVPSDLTALEQPTANTPPVTPGSAAALQRLGVGVDTYALAAVIAGCVIVLVALTMALVLVWRRGDDWMALLASLFLLVYPIGNIAAIGPGLPTQASTLETVLYVLSQLATAAVIYGGLLLFPTGRFIPRWSWVLLVAFTLWLTAGSLPLFDPISDLLALGYPLFYGTALANIVYRYRRASTPVQRQQTKWVVAGFVLSLLANQAFWLPSGLTPLGDTIYAPISYLVFQIALLFVPITFFIAVQRYRLYGIDTIINRALVYGTLSAILALVYVGGVFGLQGLVEAITGDSGQATSPVLIVVTTLAIAGLVAPLRTRIQRFVDRRFYRSKYDAARIVAVFGANLRNQTDLDELGDDLLQVVDDTLHPTQVSLWLRPMVRQPVTADRLKP